MFRIVVLTSPLFISQLISWYSGIWFSGGKKEIVTRARQCEAVTQTPSAVHALEYMSRVIRTGQVQSSRNAFCFQVRSVSSVIDREISRVARCLDGVTWKWRHHRPLLSTVVSVNLGRKNLRLQYNTQLHFTLGFSATFPSRDAACLFYLFYTQIPWKGSCAILIGAWSRGCSVRWRWSVVSAQRSSKPAFDWPLPRNSVWGRFYDWLWLGMIQALSTRYSISGFLWYLKVSGLATIYVLSST